MDGFKLNDVSDVRVGGTLAKQVYVGSTKIWDYKTPPVYTAPTVKTGLVYSGSAQVLLNTGSTEHGTIQYSSDGSSWSTDIPTSTNASNSITVYWRLVGDGRHNDVASTALTVSIAKKSLTVTAKAQTIQWGNSIATGTGQVTASGLVSGDSLTGITLTPSTSDLTTTGTITPSAASTTKGASNYSITYTAGALTISKRVITITAKGQSVTYGTAISTSTSQVTISGSGLAGSNSLTSISLAASQRIVGTGTITPSSAVIKNGSTNVTSKYSITYNTGTLTVTAKALTITAKAQTITYGSSIATGTSQVTASGLVSGDSLTAVTLTASTTDVPGGTITPSAATCTNGITNYSVTYKTGALTINKVTPTVTAPTPKALSYTGSAQALANAGNTDYGTLKYSLDNSTWSTGIPTATNQGSYTVYYKVFGNSNVNDTDSASISCSISEKEVTATVTLSQSSYTYDGSAKTPTVTVKDGSTVIPASEYTVSYSNNTNAGTATVTITDKTGGNYNVIGSATFTITQREVTLTWGTLSWTYDKSAHSTTCTAGNLVTGDTCTVTLTGNTITNKGTTTVTASSLSNGNYKLPSAKTNTLTVSARTVTFTWGTLSWTYDGSAHSTTCTAGNVVSGDTCTVTLTGNSITNAGTATVTASSLSNSNYALPSTKTATLTVNAREVTLTWGTVSWTYAKVVRSTTCTAGNLVEGDTCTVTLTGNSVGPDVGTATVTASALSNSNYVLPSEKTATIQIKQRALTLIWGTLTWVYDGAAHSTTCTAGSLLSGDSCTVTLTGNSITNKGTATVTASGLSNGNYKRPSARTATLEITARPVNVTAGSTSKTYDGTALTYNSATAEATGTDRGLASGHSMTSCTVTGTITNAGSADNVPSAAVIKSGTTDVTSNYDITYVNGTLTVSKYTPTVTLSATDRAYNGNALYATATVSKPANGATIKGTIYYGTSSGATTYSIGYAGSAVNLSSVSVTNVGSATVYAYFVPDSSCNGVYNNSGNASKTFTVSKANAVSGSVSNPSAVIFNTSAQTVRLGITGASGTVTYPTSITVSNGSGTASGWSCTNAGVVTMPANTVVGSYTITGTISIAESTNYKSGTASKTWTVTVNAKSISIPTPAGVSRAYNGSAATATFGAATGATITKYRYGTNGTSWTETTTNPSQTNAGTLYVQAYYTASANYTGSGWSSSATIAISRANISPSVAMSNWIWGETAQSPSVSGNTGGGTVTYTYLYPGASSYSSTAPTSKSDIGTYTVKAAIAVSTNYNSGEATNTFSILTNFKTSGADAFITSDGKYFEVQK